MRVAIAAGGTGGHIYPALAVARSLRARPAPPELAWIGGRRGLEAELVPPSGIELRRLGLRSLRSAGRDVHVVLDPIRLAASLPEALWLLARMRPAAIFTTGGYVAIPVLAAAWLLRIPVVLWEGNVVPGRSVRATARLAGAVAVTDGRTCEALAAERCYETGTPIRDPRAVDREAARAGLGIAASERLLLVFGGSQAVRRFSGAVIEALPALVERCTVLHVTGDAAYGEAVAAREALPDGRRSRYRPVPFLADEMTSALAAADLVVGRAGASTLAECAAFGLPLICVPYPHAAGHQRANAVAYAATGAARLVEDAAFDAAALLDAASLLDDPPAHLAMSAAARGAGRPGAADAVAALVVAAAERRPWPAPQEIARLAAGTEVAHGR
jgi:UDP-N-acetylglucosamine--N-acetylmuramyl-(pentapeptide) pyrophosphoryl-undecaprenol N-acetylglucosamine transferase